MAMLNTQGLNWQRVDNRVKLHLLVLWMHNAKVDLLPLSDLHGTEEAMELTTLHVGHDWISPSFLYLDPLEEQWWIAFRYSS